MDMTVTHLADSTFYTSLGVRLRRVHRTPGRHNWLLFPGGPGIGSESLLGLAETADLPGSTWLVDFPGDGSNVDAPGAPTNPYSLWPQVVLEAVDAVSSPIAIGHSMGGEYLLSVPEVEQRLRGLVLISTAPDAGWMPTFEAMCQAHPLPEVAAATEAYEADPTVDRLRDLAVASAPWNFTAAGVDAGRRLLADLPYNPAAVDWSAEHFDQQYVSNWWPATLPTMIISGDQDRIVDQCLWNDGRYQTSNVDHITIEGAGHFPWIDQPGAVRSALHRFSPLS